MSGRIALALAFGMLLMPCAAERATGNIKNVRDYGAVGDGITDDTEAVQRALDEVGGTGGGIVSLPTGNYLIETHLNVPSFVTLEGVWTIPTAFSQMQGSTLLAVEGEGNEEATPFIMLQPNATLKGVTVFYPNQDEADIKPYPWCIAAIGDNPSIIDVLLVNPYLGVYFGTQKWGHRVGRYFIRNLYGQPLRKGIFVDGCLDIGRIENVHFWPFWAKPDNGFTQKHGEAFIFGRTDWQYCFNTFTYGYKVSYKFIRTDMGVCNGNFLGIGAEGGDMAIYVEDCSSLSLLITNGEFSSFGLGTKYEVATGPEFTGSIQFQNCSFWGPTKNIAFLQGQGTSSFDNCNFVRWSYQEAPQPAIDCFGGELSVTGCKFRATGAQVHLREAVQQAVFADNLCRGPELILNESKGQAVIHSNVFAEYPEEEKGAIVVDNAMMKGTSDSGYFEADKAWSTYAGGKSYLGSTAWISPATQESKARWTVNIKRSGNYEVFVWFGAEKKAEKNATNATFAIRHRKGFWHKNNVLLTRHEVDTTEKPAEWRSLGTYSFSRKDDVYVEVSNNANGRVLADAIKFVPR